MANAKARSKMTYPINLFLKALRSFTVFFSPLTLANNPAKATITKPASKQQNIKTIKTILKGFITFLLYSTKFSS